MRKRKLITYLLLFLFVNLSYLSFGQIINDECAGAIEIPVNQDYTNLIDVSGTFESATHSPELTTGSSDLSYNDVWFKFTATSVLHKLTLSDIQGSTSSSYRFFLYGGNVDSVGTVLLSKTFWSWDDPKQIYLPNLIVGQVYFIRLSTPTTTPEYTTFKLSLNTVPASPFNDECSGALVIPVNTDYSNSLIASGTLINSTLSLPVNSCSSYPKMDVWYSFVAENQYQLITLSNLSDSQILSHAIYSEACGSFGTPIKCNLYTNQSLVTNLVIGHVYYIRVFINSSLEIQDVDFTISIGTPPTPPVNDECNNAIQLPVNSGVNCSQVTTGSFINALPSPTPYSSNSEKDIWYSFTATNTIHYIIASNFNMNNSQSFSLNFYGGICDNLGNQLYGTNYYSNFCLINLTVGQTYFIQAKNNSSTPNSSESFDICITSPEPPLNDEVINAIDVPVNLDNSCSLFTQGALENSTKSLPQISCIGNSNYMDVWHKFTATSNIHQITYSNITGTNLVKYCSIYGGRADSLGTPLICHKSNDALLLTDLIVGNVYFIRTNSLSSPNTFRTTNFILCVSTVLEPSNDECVNAIDVPINNDLECQSVVTSTLTGASSTSILSLVDCNSIDYKDVWFKFTATNTTHVIRYLNLNGTQMSMYSSLYGGRPDSLGLPLYCAINSSSLMVSDLVIGNIYFLRSFINFPSTFLPFSTNFDVCIGVPESHPVNDECVNAINVPVNPTSSCVSKVTGTILNASDSGLPSTCFSTSSIAYDVWYSFVATSTAHQISLSNLSNPASSLRTIVYSGNCNGLSSMFCNTSLSTLNTGFILGNTYYIRVYSLSYTDSTSFDLCVSAFNDNVSDAVPILVSSNYDCSSATSGTLLGSTHSNMSDNCYYSSSTGFKDVWYRFVATKTSATITVSNTGSSSLMTSLYGGTVSNLGSSLLCSSSLSNDVSNLVIGNTYFVRVSCSTSLYTNLDFTICISSPEFCTNNELINAISLPVNVDLNCLNSVSGSLFGATHSIQANAQNYSNPNDVWFTFVATNTAHVLTFTQKTPSTVSLEVTLNNGTSSSFGSEVLKGVNDCYFSGLVIGNSYIVRVSSSNSTATPCIFQICLGTPIETAVNDEKGNAITLTVNSDYSCTSSTDVNMNLATPSLDAPICSFATNGRDLWYKFVATSTSHRIQFSGYRGESSYSIVNSLNEVVKCAYSMPSSEDITNFVVGETYHLRILNSTTEMFPSTFTICIGTPSPTALNSDCFQAINIPVNNTSVCDESLVGQFENQNTNNNTTWYKFVATDSKHKIKFKRQYPNTGSYTVYNGLCSSLNTLFTSSYNDSTFLTNLIIGNTYLIKVTSTFLDVCITVPDYPVNDDCSGAVQVPVNLTGECVNSINGTINNALPSPLISNTCNSYADDDVWYKFTALNTSHRINLLNISPSTSLRFDVFSGNCNSLVLKSSEFPNGCSSIETDVLHDLVIGQTYYMRVYSINVSNQSPFTNYTTNFTICVTSIPLPPSNDEAISAINIPVNPTPYCALSTEGTLESATFSSQPNTCSNSTNNDVWFVFTALETSQKIKYSITGGSYTSLGLVVYSSNNGAVGTSLACLNNSVNTSLNVSNLLVGDTYFLRVFQSSYTGLNTNNNTDFEICIQQSDSPLSNDECSTAINVPVNPDYYCGLSVDGTLELATASPQTNSCGSTYDDDDVWYRFVATNTEHRISLINVSGTYTDLYHAVYNGDCTTLNNAIVCSDLDVSNLTNLTIGNTYLIRVYTGATTTDYPTKFSICIGTKPAPPQNDICANATLIPVNSGALCSSSVSGSVEFATVSSQPTSCLSGNDDDVWFKFVATAPNLKINISNIHGSTLDLIHSVYNGTCGNLGSSISCNDLDSSNHYGLISGATYYVRVYTKTTVPLQTTSFDVCITTLNSSPLNDNCISAISVPVNSGTTCIQKVDGTILYASNSGVTSNCAGTQDDDVWYSFVATSSSHTISLENVSGSTTDLNFSVFSGACSSLGVPIKCSAPLFSTVTGLIVGNTYYINVYSATNIGMQSTNFSICITTPPAIVIPVNDDCENALSLTVIPDLSVTPSLSGTILNATASIQSNTCGSVNDDDDVWYSFVASESLHQINLLNIVGSTLDLYCSVYDGNPCSTLGSALFCCNLDVSPISNLIPGNTYYIRVYSLSALPNQTTTFDICVNTPFQVPSNDECSFATALQVNSTVPCLLSTEGTLSGATNGFSGTGCSNFAFNDVWYSFVATSTYHSINVTSLTESPIDYFHTVYAGNCTNLGTPLICSDANISVLTGLTVGSVYYIRLYSKTSLVAGIISNFSICVNTPLTPPVNDECINATPLVVNNDTTCAQAIDGTIENALPSNQPNVCYGAVADDDVWYSFVATNTRHYVNLNSISGSTVNLFHSVYSGNCTTLGYPKLCSDPENSLLTNLIIGNTYYIRVYSVTGTPGQNTTFSICINTPPDPPLNDDCSGAFSLVVNENFTCTEALNGTIENAWPSYISPSCSQGYPNDDVWFKFTATRTKHFIALNDVAGSTLNLYHSVYGGNCNNLGSPFICSDPDYSTLANLIVGDTYYVRVYSFSSVQGQNTTFSICIQSEPLPINDECSNAIEVQVNQDGICEAVVVGTTQYATPSSQPSCQVTGASDVWYKFTATSTSHIINVFNVNGGSIYYDLYSGNCNTLVTTSICYRSNANSVSNLIIGEEYFLRIFNNSTVANTFNVCIRTANVPVLNDNCSDAIVVPVNTDATCNLVINGSILDATPSQVNSTNFDDDVWYSFVATNPIHAINISNIQGPTNEFSYQLIGWCVNGSTLSSATFTGSTLLSNLAIGSTYLIRLASSNYISGEATSFDICINTPVSPINDECINAINVPVSPTSSCSLYELGTLSFATMSTETNTCNSNNATNVDVWFSFIATSTSHVVNLNYIDGTNTTLKMAVYTGTCGNLSLYSCSNSYNTAPLPSTVIGQIYYVRVYANAQLPTTNFNICVTTSPSNDQCANAANLPVNSSLACLQTVDGNLQSSTGVMNYSFYTCAPFQGDVWYTFVATNPIHKITLSNLGNVSALQIAVYNGTCTSLGTPIFCGNSYASAGSVLTGLIVGDTYLVSVMNTNTTSRQSRPFTICLATPVNLAVNDDCQNAIVASINSGSQCTVVTAGTITNSTPSSTITTCGGYDDVWFKFDATHPNLRIDLLDIVGNYTSLNKTLYAGTCSALGTPIGCNQTTYSNLIVGNTYYLRISSSYQSGTQNATFNLCIRPFDFPMNDDCVNAISVPVNTTDACDQVTHGNLQYALTSSQSNSCNSPVNNDIWYKFIATSTHHEVRLLNFSGSTSNLKMTVHQGSCSNLSYAFQCNNLYNNLQGLTVGATYYIRVFNNTSLNYVNAEFDVCVNVYNPIPPANDNCENAISLIVNSNSLCANYRVGSTTNATPSPQNNTCANSNDDDDVWYKFVATNTTHTVTLYDLAGTSLDVYHSVYSGDCSDLGSPIICNDNNVSELNGLTVGQTYYVRIYTSSNLPNLTCSFKICIGILTPPPPCLNSTPAGNTCATALPICDLNGYCGTTSGTYTADSWPAFDTTFCGTIENNSFLSFVPTTTSISFNVWVTSTVTGLGIQIFIFSANDCQGPVTNFTCWDPHTVPSEPVLISANGLVPGQKYYIMIDGQAGDICDYVFGSSSDISSPVNLTSTVQTICLGDSVLINASGGDNTFNWPINSDLTIISSNSAYYTPSFTGNTTLVISSYGDNALCSSSNNASLNFTNVECLCPIFASNNSDSCMNNSFNLMATTIQGATYLWSGPDGFSSVLQNPQNVTPPQLEGTYSYTVLATSQGQTCSSTTEVVVKPTEIAFFSYPNSLNCLTSTEQSPVMVGTLGGSFFSSPVGLSIDSQSGIIVPSLSAIGNYTISYSTGGNCSATFSNQISIVGTPVVSPVANQSVCEGVNFEAINFTGSSGATYTWSNSNSLIGLGTSGNGNIMSFSTTGTTQDGFSQIGNIEVIPDNGTCNGIPVIFTLQVNPLPVVDPVVNQSVCEGVNFEAINFTGSSGATYTWSNSNSLIGLGTSGNGNIMSFSASGTTQSGSSQIGNIEVIPNNGTCTGIPVMFTLQVNPLPNVEISNLTNTCVYSNSIQLTGGLPLGGNYSGIGVSEEVFNPATAGIGTFVITYSYSDLNDCSNTASTTIVVDECAGIEEFDMASKLNVFPNPTSGQLTIQWKENFMFELTDSYGKIILRGDGENELILDVESIERGVYYIRIMSGEHSVLQKIVVQ